MKRMCSTSSRVAARSEDGFEGKSYMCGEFVHLQWDCVKGQGREKRLLQGFRQGSGYSKAFGKDGGYHSNGNGKGKDG
jgi:hypothetical protein